MIVIPKRFAEGGTERDLTMRTDHHERREDLTRRIAHGAQPHRSCKLLFGSAPARKSGRVRNDNMG